MTDAAVVDKSVFEAGLSALRTSTAYTQASQQSQQQQIGNFLLAAGTLARKLGVMAAEAFVSLQAAIRAFGQAPITDVSAWFAAWWLSCFGLSPWPAAGTEG